MEKDNILNFVTLFTQVEAKASSAQVRPDLNFYGQCVDELHDFASPQMAGTFGVAKRTRPFPQQLYDNFRDSEPFEPARIFRIDRWRIPVDREIAGVFASQLGEGGFKKYFHLYIIEELDGKLKIVRKFYLDTLENGTRKWTPNGGDESIQYEALPKPYETLRLMEPSDDADSMKLYLAD